MSPLALSVVPSMVEFHEVWTFSSTNDVDSWLDLVLCNFTEATAFCGNRKIRLCCTDWRKTSVFYLQQRVCPPFSQEFYPSGGYACSNMLQKSPFGNCCGRGYLYSVRAYLLRCKNDRSLYAAFNTGSTTDDVSLRIANFREAKVVVTV